MNVKISNGIVRKKQKVVIYGPEGIGKSTLASHFPKPLFVDTEGSTGNLNVNRFEDKPSSWSMLLNYIDYVKNNPGICGTLVIDTIDWAERLCIEDVLATHNKKGIEDFGYGNGYVYVAEAMGRFLNLLSELTDKNICNVVLNCHAKLKKFEQPDELGAYDRYELKLGKMTGSQTAPLVKEWADMMLFCNYETFAIQADKDGRKFKGQGGQRVMYTEHHPCWDAKNRVGLPPKLPLDYSAIAHVIEDDTVESKEKVTQKENITAKSQKAEALKNTPDKEAPAPASPPNANLNPDNFEAVGIDENIPKALRDLMVMNGVSESEIQFAVSEAGYFPEQMPVANYPPDFIDGVLIGAWDQVFKKIKDNRTLPF